MFERLKSMQSLTPQGLQLQWQPNVGGEQEQDQGVSQMADAGLQLRDWLNKRRIQQQQSRQTDTPQSVPGNVA